MLLPLAAMIFLWLPLSGTTRAAIVWIFSVLVCVAVTAASKIFFWGYPPISDLHSPSGHMGLSVLVYGTTALITAVEGGAWRPRLSGRWRCRPAIAVPRLLLHKHTSPRSS